ncbi:hypothetical protein [Aequorivita sp. CIP111184]|uniref:hypothetical protein n=1 Tax=Aequorivita sp. CIP111184 TaxID=2211356 RepID=UPI000DBC23C4|nr:hypothetical protein [Aequorivita sp. CIP111184]SRX53812.1 hypothetical protein AEQU1_00892 [Aequorivita sp. CIP111184]
MKNATSFFLLFIFSFNIGGSYVIFKIQQNHIRREIVHQIKLGISEKDLTSITVSSENENQLIWKDHEEFRYKGTMYDIVHIEILDENTKVYHCISDSQETNLIAKYNKDFKKKRKDKNNRTNSVKSIKYIEKINPIPQKEELAFSNKVIRPNFIYHDNYASLSLEILSPPPKQVL